MSTTSPNRPTDAPSGRPRGFLGSGARKSIAITQSNYLPWKGYFDTINLVDEFVVYDEVQYTRRDWRNRNRIKTAHGLQWLTVPVEVKGRFDQRIDETRVSDPNWAAKHWSTLRHAYGRASHFDDIGGAFGDYLTTTNSEYLSEVNRDLIELVCRLIGIDTVISSSTDYGASGTRSGRLVDICERAPGAAVYWTGPAAKAYLDETLFHDHQIEVRYLDYTGYPEYPQLWGPFEHSVSIVDLLFNVGREAAPRYMKSFQ